MNDQQNNEKETYEGYTNEVYYFQRNVQRNLYHQIIDKIINDIVSLSLTTDQEKKNKLNMDIKTFATIFSLQSFLLDNQLSVILGNHREYEKMKAEIEKYENAVDMRAKAEIQNLYLQQSLQNMDFLKKIDINQLSSEQKQ
ncbi:hypothetical protein TTHERM_00316620 (macronuclear) [Tetrahymena thermophila SB210]|uniref:Uncharacterized protein n=1 Tax=Tetrahymena thermophila (strain SB210) TaxID=312017 RepID=I7MG54_TETTS|nr:hypothetical protein TTHERM_00316620 [Tetrahymena thermophila SB210]EAS01109.3 hypothetical protein TTHERM_00316620 [Tetrahymena thermophila SB210]|eukprot:XP_001021354.3 hypothetical protein TTHERM_00316620 [Tetrahymena thermophila SB210]